MNTVIVMWSLVSVLTIVYAQNACVTPNGEQATCIPFVRCRPLVLQLSDSTNEFDRFLRDSLCEGGTNQNPMVCCGTVGRYQTVNAPASATPPQRVPPTPKPLPIPTSPPPTRASALAVKPSYAGTYRHRNLNLVPAVGECGAQESQDRVFGGEETGIDEFPWMALLEYEMNGQSVGHSCGGVILSERYVLTAAHCITGRIIIDVGNLFRVRLGEYNRATTRDCVIVQGKQDCAAAHQDIMVEEAFAHAEYIPTGNQLNDIGIIRLASNINMNEFVRSICLPINVASTLPGQNLTTAGWGTTENNVPSQIKLKVNLPVVSNEQCNSIFVRTFRVQITDSQLCAGAEHGRDSCRGDSGGPIMTTFPDRSEYFVEGIVSFGSGMCGTAGIPGIYTRVSSYLDWILDHMRAF